MKTEKDPYKPLPNYLSIGPSDIHGVGIIATEDIPGELELGTSHVYDPNFQHNYIRTPLGGFINHSDEPNCHKIESPEESAITYYSLVASRDIEEWEELTLSYTLYNVEKDN